MFQANVQEETLPATLQTCPDYEVRVKKGEVQSDIDKADGLLRPVHNSKVLGLERCVYIGTYLPTQYHLKHRDSVKMAWVFSRWKQYTACRITQNEPIILVFIFSLMVMKVVTQASRVSQGPVVPDHLRSITPTYLYTCVHIICSSREAVSLRAPFLERRRKKTNKNPCRAMRTKNGKTTNSKIGKAHQLCMYQQHTKFMRACNNATFSLGLYFLTSRRSRDGCTPQRQS